MSFTVRVTCARRTFATGAPGTHPPNGVTWALGVITAPGTEQPAFAIADSSNPRGITVTPDATPSGDSVNVELTIPLDLTLLLGDLAVFGSSAKACALSLFGDGGFDASAPSNDWWVARRVFPVVQQEGPSFIPASSPHVEIKVLSEATTVYLSGPSHGYQYNPVGSYSYDVTGWEWTFPDGSTHSGQHVAFTHPEPATGQIDVINLAMTMVPTDGSTGPIVVSGPIIDVVTTNLLPVSFTTHDLFTATVNGDAVTFADDGCYDPGYIVSANLHDTVAVLMSSTIPIGAIADWFWRVYRFEAGEVEDEVTNAHRAPAPATFTVTDMEPGGYAVRLTLTDLWGGQSTSLREVFTIDPLAIGSALHPAGVLFTAVQSPDDASKVQIYKFPTDVASREALALISNAREPSLWLDDAGALILQVVSPGTPTRALRSLDGGATFESL